MLRFMVDVDFVCFKLLLFWCENRPEISLSQSRRSWEKGGVGITGRSLYFITKSLDGGLVSRKCRQWSLSKRAESRRRCVGSSIISICRGHDGKVLSTAIEVFRCNVTGRNRPAAEVAGRGRNAQADAAPQHHGRLSQTIVMCVKALALIIRVPGFFGTPSLVTMAGDEERCACP